MEREGLSGHQTSLPTSGLEEKDYALSPIRKTIEDNSLIIPLKPNTMSQSKLTLSSPLACMFAMFLCKFTKITEWQLFADYARPELWHNFISCVIE